MEAQRTSTFHGFTGPFPLDNLFDAFTAVDIVDHTLSLRSLGLFGSSSVTGELRPLALEMLPESRGE